MSLAKVGLRTSPPCANKVVIQSSTDDATGSRDHTSSPFFDDFRAGSRRDTLNHSRDKSAYHFFFQQFPADIHTRSARCGDPEFRGFIIGAIFESIDKAQFLDGSKSNR